MASTFTSSLRLGKQAVGDNDAAWGTVFHTEFSDLVDSAIGGYTTVAMSDANTTLTASNGAADQSRSMVLNFTGTLTAGRNIVVPNSTKVYFIRNNTTGGFALTVKTSAGTGVAIAAGTSRMVASDGTNVVELITGLPSTAVINGELVGYLNIPQNIKSADYTLVANDAAEHIYHPSADTTARIWTIPANASVAYPIGTTLTFVNDTGAGTITITVTSDVLALAGSGATGSRTLTASGVATALKVTATRWIISGTNIA